MAGYLLPAAKRAGRLLGRIVNLLLSANAVLIGANLLWSGAAEFVLGLGHRHHNMALTIPLLAMGAGLAVGYIASAVLRAAEGRCVVWGVRAAITAELALAWLSFRQANWLQLAVCVVLLCLLSVAHQMARSYALGWISDDDGERQKVTTWLRGRAFFTVTSFKERLQREVAVRDERRRSLMWMTLWSGGAIYVALRLRPAGPSLLFYAVCGIGLLLLLGWGLLVLKEIFYQLGYQDMDGHKVLDHEPTLPGMQTVIEQKAHGNAGLASLGEALRLLRPGG